ncbi:pentatricopeptide repeat-containing protein At3g42630 [Vigna unguiculata]|uniref:Pentatricopeptide repeat n=1 Tax=Vigna unguiculata TaxID=3917 RepID=A0A4D6MPZ6_VIGUN|nr:pentatricopeptide repeat-containing protein At3g42630 [Vigna unguiculata]QCE03108.1 Pentatricopeptide repeat [Vigna unguiculata]
MEINSLTLPSSRMSILLKDSPSGAPQQHNKIIWRRNEKRAFDGTHSSVDSSSLVQNNSRKRMFPQSDGVFHDTKVDVSMPKQTSLCVLMLHYTENGLFPQAQTTWEQLLYSSFVPSVEFISRLFDAYAKHGKFDEVVNILRYVDMRKFSILPNVYSLAISCFGREGQLELMEDMAKEMASRGVHVSSKTANAFVLYYSIFGSLKDMEHAYGRLKRSRFMIEREVIRAMASAYTRDRQFYELGEFLRDVGLGRKDVGNLIWNLLLLSYAANFKMKSLQKEFLQMVESGFRPDITTFNIRALAFSRMALFWDLHLSIEHMEHERVIPDLVTFGCVVDAYLDRGLGRNLDFVLNKMNLDHSPMLLTDPFVYEALGKGDFQMSSEAFLEFKTQQRKWTYRALIQKYLKKHYRRDQIFWNY